jgi:hypothetical protein
MDGALRFIVLLVINKTQSPVFFNRKDRRTNIEIDFPIRKKGTIIRNIINLVDYAN